LERSESGGCFIIFLARSSSTVHSSDERSAAPGSNAGLRSLRALCLSSAFRSAAVSESRSACSARHAFFASCAA
jgi:hypothetical protein